MIRLAKRGDLPAILSIFSYARKFMSQQGNPTQWGTTYPSRKLVRILSMKHAMSLKKWDKLLVSLL